VAFDYARSRSSADRLIANFGQTGTIERPTASTGPAYDPTPGTPASHAVTFAVTDYRNQEIDGVRVLATDKKVLLAKAGLSIEPTTSDKLLIGGVSHSIVRIEPLSPAGTVVMWTLQVRK